MKSKTTDYVLVSVCMVIVGLVGLGSGIKVAKITTEHVAETTIAKPIYQQQIGDEAEPDVLIIYEAEVDGETVYPSVVKEAE